MTQHYQFGDQLIRSDDPGFSKHLEWAHQGKQRPLCVCRKPHVEMYVAKASGRFIIKRMPNTGSSHAPMCDSYEPPAELSGLGQVMGSAIQEDPTDGNTSLKLDFSLTKVGGRAAPLPSGSESDSVSTDGTKLTLRGTLHYLWEEAGFNRWVPGMEGKRSWYVIRKYLLQAADGKRTKGTNLADILYIPESFNPEKKAEITQRRVAMMNGIATSVKGGRRLMLTIGEVKELGAARYGHKIVFKHLPDCHFMVNEDLHKRLQKRFGTEIALWDAIKGSHLVAIGTISMGTTGVVSLEEIALMLVTDNWLPVEHTFDATLLDGLIAAKRRFAKGLRYNLSSSRPLASVVLSDTLPAPTAMYIIPLGASDDYLKALAELRAESVLGSWEWDAGDASPMPDFPAAGESDA